MSRLFLLVLLATTACSSYRSDRRKKAEAIAADTKKSDTVALGEIAKTCFFDVQGNPKGGKTKTGGYAMAFVTRGMALTNATSVESLKSITRTTIAWQAHCTLAAGRSRHLESIGVQYALPVGPKEFQNVYLFSLDLAELEAIDGWEKLDPEDSDDMAKVWSKGRVIKGTSRASRSPASAREGCFSAPTRTATTRPPARHQRRGGRGAIAHRPLEPHRYPEHLTTRGVFDIETRAGLTGPFLL